MMTVGNKLVAASNILVAVGCKLVTMGKMLVAASNIVVTDGNS
jgi:hypothetical protein